jgi:hypothetical protein
MKNFVIITAMCLLSAGASAQQQGAAPADGAAIDKQIEEAQKTIDALKAQKAELAKKKVEDADKAAADTEKAAAAAKEKAAKAKAAADEANGNASKNDEFWNNFGVGLAVSTKLGKRGSAIEEAQLVNGVVRVSSERDVVPRLMLERHWYFTERFDNLHFRQGVFVGASLFGDKKLMDSVTLGWLVAFKPNDGDKSTHNLGIGLSVEPYSKELGDGIKANQPLPTGENAIRYKEKNRLAITVIYTYTMGK